MKNSRYKRSGSLSRQFWIRSMVWFNDMGPAMYDGEDKRTRYKMAKRIYRIKSGKTDIFRFYVS